MIASLDTLPALDSPYRVTADQSAAYARDGHVLLRGVASREEVASYQPIIHDAVMRHNRESRKVADRDAYHQAFLQIANLWETDPAAARFVTARRFAQVAADLMGVDGVRLYHDQALFKEPGGGPTFWHQDQYYWPIDTVNTITMWMPLVNVSLDMGALTFATGSHQAGCVASMAISTESHQAIEEYLATRDFPIAREAMCAGDATFHSGWTLHMAPGNNTDLMREIMTVIYVADGARIVEPDNPHRPADLARWFPGQKPGELIGSHLNPLLYSRKK